MPFPRRSLHTKVTAGMPRAFLTLVTAGGYSSPGCLRVSHLPSIVTAGTPAYNKSAMHPLGKREVRPTGSLCFVHSRLCTNQCTTHLRLCTPLSSNTFVSSHSVITMMLVHATLTLCITAISVSAAPVPAPSTTETVTYTSASYSDYITSSSTRSLTVGEMRTISVPEDVARADPDKYLPATEIVKVSVIPVGEPVWYTTTETYEWK